MSFVKIISLEFTAKLKIPTYAILAISLTIKIGLSISTNGRSSLKNLRSLVIAFYIPQLNYSFFASSATDLYASTVRLREIIVQEKCLCTT